MFQGPNSGVSEQSVVDTAKKEVALEKEEDAQDGDFDGRAGNGAEGALGESELVEAAPDPPDGEAQPIAVNGVEFGNENAEPEEKQQVSDKVKESRECKVQEYGTNQGEETSPERNKLPSNLQFPRWEIPAVLFLYTGLPNRSVK